MILYYIDTILLGQGLASQFASYVMIWLYLWASFSCAILHIDAILLLKLHSLMSQVISVTITPSVTVA